MQFAISSLNINNYRQYRGSHTLEFEIDKKKNVQIINGRNGAGKSNILNAITWCLYGIEVHKEKEIYEVKGMPIINTSELDSLKPNDITLAEVTIHLKANGIPWTIKRTRNGGKTALGDKYVDELDNLQAIYTYGGQDKIESGRDAQILIDDLLPEVLKNFFFIDGEQLREFFKVSSNSNISDAIEKVSQLDLLYRTAEHLDDYEVFLNKNIKNATPDQEKYKREIQRYNDLLAKKREDLKKEEINYNNLNEEFEEVNKFLRNNNDSRISDLHKERTGLLTDKKNLDKNLSEKISERNKYLVGIAPYIYLKKDLELSHNIISEKIDKGELPPKIKITLVDELIEKGVCICGNQINDEARKILTGYKNKLTYSELGEITILGKTYIEEIFGLIKEFPDKIDSFNENIDDLSEDINRKVRRIDEISDELKDFNHVKIQEYEKRYQKLILEIGRSDSLKKIHNSDIIVFENKLEEAKESLEKELKKDLRYAELTEKLKIVRDTLKNLSNIELEIKTKIRKQVEYYTNQNFKTLIRKKDTFKDITIDEEYRVQIFHKDGYNVINDLSAGEYLILGLSFMSALMTISGFQAPVIIDTPLGKIDDEHRQYITSELPKFLEGTQLILLMTPTEYDANVEKNLKEFLIPSNYFKIIENEGNSESKVVQ